MFSADPIEDPAETSLPELAKWVREIALLTKPDDVVWCDGSQAEWERLTSLLGSGPTAPGTAGTPCWARVLRAADCIGDGAGRGLAGRAHAHPQDHSSFRGAEVHRGRVPVRVR
jgi:hypothetical protein